MKLHIKKFVMVKENVTPGVLKASHQRFWQYIKDKALRVMWEDKDTVGVVDEGGEQHDIPKSLVHPVSKEALVG